MGKRATARLFAEAGCAVWDADAAVHRLYEEGGAGVAEISKLAPGAVRDGAVDRAALGGILAEDPDLFPKLNAAIHPLVAADRENAFRTATAPVFVADIPLFFEGGAADGINAVVVVTAPESVRRARVLERPGMTLEKFEMITSRQTPDAEKRARADYILWTHAGLDLTRAGVASVTADLRRRFPNRL